MSVQQSSLSVPQDFAAMLNFNPADVHTAHTIASTTDRLEALAVLNSVTVNTNEKLNFAQTVQSSELAKPSSFTR